MRILCLTLTLGTCARVFADDVFNAGPLWDEFPLTLSAGQRTEALGPLYYDQQKDSEKTWAIPPLFSHSTDPDVESLENDFLYPLMTYEHFGKEYRWQFIQLFSVSGGANQDETEKHRVTIFPIYFQQRSTKTNENYTALFPIGGRIQNRLFRDDIHFVLFPIYGQSRKRDVITDNYVWPIFHLREGNGLHGWQFWPLVGAEHKVVTTFTNTWDEVETNGGHVRYFWLWPIHFSQSNNIGTDNPEKFRANIPLYSYSRSPKRDSTTVIWPFFSLIDDRDKKYREWQLPWPIVILARGEGKTTSRLFPIVSRAYSSNYVSEFFLWPLYKYNRIKSAPLDQGRTRILFYLYQSVTEKNLDTGKAKRREDFWPLFTWRRDLSGNERLQILAPIEPILPNNRGVERNWSPLWSLWRAENNPTTGASSRSLLWNLYRSDRTPESKKCSLLFGLFQYQSNTETKKLRLFFIPMVTVHKTAEAPKK
jgi:hypothetical protein